MLIVTPVNTGTRNHETCNRLLSDIDWNRSELVVYGKGGKRRIIPLTSQFLQGKKYPSLKNYIKHWRYPTDKRYLFTRNPRNKREVPRITPVTNWYAIKNAAREIGSPWITPHSLRHYYATNLAASGVHITIIQAILGHASITTTARYLHLVECNIHTAAELFRDPILKKRKNHCRILSVMAEQNYDFAKSIMIRCCNPVVLNPLSLRTGVITR